MHKKHILKIAFTGGGTGGHVMPIIAIARELTRLPHADDLRFYYIGPKDPLIAILLSQENIEVKPIVSGKLRRYLSWRNVIDIFFSIPVGFLQSFFLLLFIRPRLVFSKGGSGSLVVCLAASMLGITVFLHESDTVPGLSNQLVSKWAKKIFISFSKTEYFNLQKTILVGNPIKKELMEGDEQRAKELFNLTFEKPLLLFLGGSQGAQAINDFVLLTLNDLLKNYEVLHVCGTKSYKRIQMEAQVTIDKDLEKYYHLFGSLGEIELKHAYKAAQFIISRAGSGSIFEIAACGKPGILIPLPSSAGRHQSKNAYEYAHGGSAIVMEQNNLTPHFFLGKVNYLFSQPEELKKMTNAALEFSKPLAAKEIARTILAYFNEKK